MIYLADGVQLRVEYQEPTDNADGSVLDDLQHTSVFYDIGGGPVNVVDYPASLAAGGLTVIYDFVVPVLPGDKRNVTVFATATDTSGNTSAPSDSISILIDRRIPNRPFGLRFGNG